MLRELNPATPGILSRGAATNRGSETATWDLVSNGDLAFQSEHGPEPGSIGVLSLAAVGLAFGAWRRRRKCQPVTE